ncbi:hypothetical protein ACEU8V_000016 [Escherichia coli]|nr:hypothetical protein [Escherichia coli]HCQ0013129.1 hypothetical protein [Escherichia coli]
MTTPITKEQLTDDVLQDIYDVAVSCEPAEQNGAYMASFDLLCKADDVGGVAYVVRKLIDMLRAERRKAAMNSESAECWHINIDCDDGKAVCLDCGKTWEV